MKKITTTTEAHSLDDITEHWKIAATCWAGTWVWSGTLHDSGENSIFRLMVADGRVSTVMGRDAAGRRVLYARIWPVRFRIGGARG